MDIQINNENAMEKSSKEDSLFLVSETKEPLRIDNLETKIETERQPADQQTSKEAKPSQRKSISKLIFINLKHLFY